MEKISSKSASKITLYSFDLCFKKKAIKVLQGLIIQCIHAKYLHSIDFSDFVLNFHCMVSNAEQRCMCSLYYIKQLGNHWHNISVSYFLSMYLTETVLTCWSCCSQREQNRMKSHSLRHWRTFYRWFKLLCFCLCCRYSNVLKYVPGPNECLHFLFFMSHFGIDEVLHSFLYLLYLHCLIVPLLFE